MSEPRRLNRVRRRLRAQSWPILETTGAAVVAWYLAKLAFGDDQTNFAPIAALICLGATIGQQRQRAFELMGGVVLGVLIADALVALLGTGIPQVGLMVLLAMSAAAAIGGGTLLMIEAGVSAIIIGSAAPSTLGVFPVRPAEALIGGAVAFGVHLVVFPPDPMLLVSRAAHQVFGALGTVLGEVAGALRSGDRDRAERALEAARDTDDLVRALDEALGTGRETARTAPLRRASRQALEHRQDMARHLDFAVRNARVLARDALRLVRRAGTPEPDLAAAVEELARATWALAATFDDPSRAEEPRRHALLSAHLAEEAAARHGGLTRTEVAGQVRSTAADLIRAAGAGDPEGPAAALASTEEMLTAREP